MRCVVFSFILGLYLFSPPIFAQSVSFGTYVPYAFSSQQNREGSTTKFDINPFISVSLPFTLGRSSRHFILPEIGLVHHTDRADNTRVRSTFLLYNMGYRAGRQLLIRYGLGTLITRVSGKGGTVTLRDGGASREFAIPDESQTTYVSTVNLGAEYRIDRDWAAKFDTYVMTFLSSDKRKVNYSVSAVYYW